MNKLRHFWYAAKYIMEFIQKMYKQYSESIFVITGDHADRFNIDPNPSLYERYDIPFVYGKVIHRTILQFNTVGGQLNYAYIKIQGVYLWRLQRCKTENI